MSAPPGSVRIAKVTAALFLSVLLASPSLADKLERRYDKWRPITDSDWDTSSYDSLGIHHAAILFDGFIFDDSDELSDRTFTNHYLRVLVLDDKGIEEFGTVEIPFLKGDKIKKIKARTLKPDGTVIKIDKKEVFEKTLFSYGKKSTKAKSFAFKGVEKGDILEFFYVRRLKEWTPPVIQIRSRYYTFTSRVTWLFRLMPKIPWRTRHLNKDIVFVPAYTVTNGRKFGATLREVPDSKHPEGIQVLVDNLPPFDDQPYMPHEEFVTTLFFGHYKFVNLDEETPYWDRIARDWGEQTREFMKKSSKLDPWMEEIGPRTDFATDLDRCFALLHSRVKCYEFLPEHERPEKAPDIKNVNDLIKKGIGRRYKVDLLMVAMLHRLGYEATQFWVRDRSEGSFIKEWQSARQFTLSGVAVKVEEEIQWCFPSAAHCLPSSLPWQAIGCTALLEDLTEEEEENPFPTFAPVPVPESGRNRVELHVSLQPGEDLKARGRLKATWDCANDVYFINVLSGETEDEVLETLRKRVIGSDVAWEAHDEEYELDGLVVSYACSLDVEGIVEEAGSMRLVDLGMIRPDAFWFPDGKREFPVDFRFPVQYVSQVDLVIPEGFTVEEAIPGSREKRSFATFACQSQLGETRYRLRRDLDLKYNLFTPEGGAALKTFFEAAYAATSDPVVLTRAVAAE